MTPPPPISLTLTDGVRVVVPDTLYRMTPYVLIEQRDWFEDEIKFLRRLLQPGQKVIDVGANFGAYTLSMARTVGADGAVWAFEPASGTARFLAEGIAANGFAHVVLERCALSNRVGTAQLSLNDDPELNSLLQGGQVPGTSETVPVATLDVCRQRHGWQDIAFIKIDAEGEEANIIRGGERFFAELSPLVQYEIRASADLHLELARDFAAIGYASYRLVPGLDVLVPFDPGSASDGYLLNLFCCKPDRAELLAAQGFLMPSASPQPSAVAPGRPSDAGELPGDTQAYAWSSTIAQLPYGVQLAATWRSTLAGGGSADVERALACYAISRDPALRPTQRFNALQTSFNVLKSLCERDPAYLRLASLARVARDFGARSVAVAALSQLANHMLTHRQIDLREPFLAPGQRFDTLAPGEHAGNWALAAVVEELEKLEFFSSFFSASPTSQRLEIIRDLGFGSEEMKRRLDLLQRRSGLS